MPNRTVDDVAAPASQEDRWLEKEGLRYCYRVRHHDQPEFPPTLFLSGAFQTMESWARFAKAFAPFTTVILLDPPGMGRSDLLPQEFGIDFLAGCVRDLIDSQKFDRINIVAASYGTPVAYRLAQMHPDRLGRIVLAGTMREIPPHIRERVRESVETALIGNRQLLAEQVANGLLCRNPHVAIDRRIVAERVLRSGLLRMTDVELRQYASNTTRLLEHEPLDLSRSIRGPEALVFTGEHDCFTRPEHCRQVAEAFGRALFTTINRADHLFHIEQFDVVRDLLLHFMQGTLAEPHAGCGPIVKTWSDRTGSHAVQAR
jgi:pimeloyl-ACP methyl ester carboxylesterase